jgi:NAD(P)-dependent dehydrogenase (short-subunit alcohol dehydrogenase family)
MTTREGKTVLVTGGRGGGSATSATALAEAAPDVEILIDNAGALLADNLPASPMDDALNTFDINVFRPPRIELRTHVLGLHVRFVDTDMTAPPPGAAEQLIDSFDQV